MFVDMDVIEALEVLARSGVSVARMAFREQAAPRARKMLAERFGVESSRAGQLMRLGLDLFGPSEDPELQDEAVRIAEQEELGIQTLIVINRAVNHLEPHARLSKGEVRVQLHRFAAGKMVDEVRRHANEWVRELNDATRSGSNDHLRWLRISGTADVNGMRYLNLKLPDLDMARLQSALMARVQRHPDERLEQSLADAALTAITSATTPSKLSKREGVIVYTADGCTALDDGLLATTDGAIIHQDDLMQMLAASTGWALLYAKNREGFTEPVNMWRMERLATEHQRRILSADQITCVDPDCTRLARDCQAHHVRSWRAGGPTNLNNLVAACAPHNRQNDDDPNRRRNGHYRKDERNGLVGYQPPDLKRPIRHTVNPLARRSARRIAMRRLESPESQRRARVIASLVHQWNRFHQQPYRRRSRRRPVPLHAHRRKIKRERMLETVPWGVPSGNPRR